MSFSLDALGQIRVPGRPTVIGRSLVYSLRMCDGNKTLAHLWKFDITRGSSVQLTRGEVKDTLPVALPETASVIFVSDRGGTAQLWRLDLDGGEPYRLTAFPAGSMSALVVAPDAPVAYVIYTPTPNPDEAPLAAALARGEDPDYGPASVAPGPMPKAVEATPKGRVYVRYRNRLDGRGWETHAREQVYRVDVQTGQAERVAGGPFVYGSLVAGPGGVVYATRFAVPDDSDLGRNEVVRLTGSGISTVTRDDGLASALSLSPDGRTLSFTHQYPDDVWGSRNGLLGFVPVHGGRTRLTGAHLDRAVGDFVLDDVYGAAFAEQPAVWLGDTAVVPMTDEGSVRLYAQSLSGEGRWLTPSGLCLSNPAGVGTDIAVVHTSPSTFPEIALVVAGDVQVLTRHNAEVTAACAPRAPTAVQIRGVSRSGVPGWYLPPRSGQRGPAILYVHGGPHANYGERLVFEMQWLADQGYAVLWTNPRGSTGYGEAWCQANDGAWGGVDAQDLEDAARWLAQQPEVDPQRVGMAGGSYGGWMALHLAGTSERFAAFVAQRGLFDWSADYGAGDFGFEVPRLMGGKRPWEAPEAYWSQSSLRLVDKVRVPFLLVCQEADMRCEEGQSFAVFNALRARGIATAIVVFPEESHGMMRGGRLDRRQESMRQLHAWFAHFMVPNGSRP